jgi:hypothetical protein
MRCHPLAASFWSVCWTTAIALDAGPFTAPMIA